MAEGILQRFPDPAPILRVTADVEAGLGGMVTAIDELDPSRPGSPLAGIASAIGGLGATVDLDLSGLETRLPAALATLDAALPPSALDFVAGLEAAYADASGFVASNPVAREVTGGRTLQEVALSVVRDTLDRFDARLGELAAGLVDAETLAAARTGLADLERLRADLPAHRDELLPFLARNLLGVDPDVLAGPRRQAEAVVSVVATLDAEALAAAVDPARRALGDAARALVAAIDGVDPADAAAYGRIEAGLDALDAGVRAMASGLTELYDAAGAAVASQGWDALLSAYREALEAVALDRIPTLDGVVDVIAGTFEELRRRLSTVLDEADLAERVDLLIQAIDDTVATSGLSRVRQTLEAALDDVREAIDAVPVESVQEAVQGMLARIGHELDGLGIEGIVADLETALDGAADRVATTFTPQLLDATMEGLEDLLRVVDNLPVPDLAGLLTAAMTQLSELLGEVQRVLEARMDEISSLAAGLEDLSFVPVSDAVIDEIDEVRTRLEAIDPASLSEVERLAIRTALAVLEALDLEGEVMTVLRSGYAATEGEVRRALGELARLLERLRQHLGTLDPRQALARADELVADVLARVEELNGALLVGPLREQLEGLEARLRELAPGQLLAPLDAPYDAVMAAVGRLDPNAWVTPLRDLHAGIDDLLGRVDVRPLLAELDGRRRALLGQVRGALLDAVGALDLPEPLDALLDDVRPVLEGMADAIFDDPDGELRRIAGGLPPGLDVTRPLALLDAPFDRLVALAEEVPAEDLTAALEVLRRSVGTALEVLDPRNVVERLRAAEGRLAALAPPVVLAPALAVPALRAGFAARCQVAPPERAGDVARVSARFEASFELVDPDAATSVANPLFAAHAALAEALGRRLDALDPAEAAEAYGRLRSGLDRIVPDFLRGTVPITHDAALAGLASLRPSLGGARVDASMRRFLADLEPLESAVADAADRLFGCVRRTLALVDPLALSDALDGIYDAIRARVGVLDPDALATAAQGLLDKVTAPLRAVDPRALGQRLTAAYDRVVAAVGDQLSEFLDRVAAALDERLRRVRAAIAEIAGAVRDVIRQASEALGAVTERFEQLVFVELIARLERVLDNLGASFDRELERVRTAFDAMLAAIPVGGGGGREAAVGA